jgi:hypothetical protein
MHFAFRSSFAKLDGLRRKLHKKLQKLEQKEKNIRERTEECGQPKKIAKLERKAKCIKQKMNRTQSRLEDVSMERDERATVIDQLYAMPAETQPTTTEPADLTVESNEAEIATAVEAMTIEEDDAPAMITNEVDAATENVEQPAEQPAEQPMVAYEYQKEFEQILDFGFDAEPNVVRYLLTENKGNVGAVVNNLLAAS